MVRSSIRRIRKTALSIMVHEFGHFSNLAHTQTNGGILLGIAVGSLSPAVRRRTTPSVSPTVADFFNNGLLETMYPFFFGPAVRRGEHWRSTISRRSRGCIPQRAISRRPRAVSGSIFAPNGTTRLSGVNVIARNVANPFLDAVSALSGDFTDEIDPGGERGGGNLPFHRIDSRRAVRGVRRWDPGRWLLDDAARSAGTGGVRQRRSRVEHATRPAPSLPWWRRRARRAPASTSSSTCRCRASRWRG